jgi:small-conductance mechanosensitive channel/cell division protein FtsB
MKTTSRILFSLLGLCIIGAVTTADAATLGDSTSEHAGRTSVAASNSAIEIFQNLLQGHQQLNELRAERETLNSEIKKTEGELEDLGTRLQSTPATLPGGESNPKRELLERRLESAQSQLNSLNQKLSRVEDRIDDQTASRRAQALTLIHRIFSFLIIAFAIWVLARILRRIPARIVKEEQDRFYINKVITYSSRLVVVLIFLYTIFGEFASLSPFLGLTGAGIAIALQDVIVSFIAWFFIIGRRGLSIGDRIEVSNVRGDVIDIGVLRIVVREVGNWLSNEVPTGRRVFIPNSFVFKNYFFNHSRPQPFINDEIKMLFTFESNWEKALDLVRESARKALEEFFKQGENASELIPQDESFTRWGHGVEADMPQVFTRIAECGVEIRLIYVTRVRDRNRLRDILNRAILKGLAGQTDITLAYPTSRAISTPPGVKP